MENTILELDTTDQQQLNRRFANAIEDKNVHIKIKFDDKDKDGQVFGSGRHTLKTVQSAPPVSAQQNDGDEEGDNHLTDDTNHPILEEDEEKDSINVSLTKDVLTFLIPLSCILTINTEDRDILEMLNSIKTNPGLLEIFKDQTFIWWNNVDIIEMVERMVEKYIQKDSSIYNVAIHFKMSLQSLIDKPTELLELIESCLKPKQKEKQENGEVFTPMALIYEMLENLDNHYQSNNGRSIFSVSSLKWFDPACGMGNFPVAIFLKLMEGLKREIPDDEERKRHILENMLYMSELNKKNVFICHQIFNMDNQIPRLNLYEGDTIQLLEEETKIKSIWNISPKQNQFDIIIGNPPFNKGNITATRKTSVNKTDIKHETVWPNFIEKSIQYLKPNDGYLVFINPLTWLKRTHVLHNQMLEKTIVWMKLWDNSQSKHAIHADIPISIYILKNTENIEQTPTIITSVLRRRNLTKTTQSVLNKTRSIPLAFHSIFDKLIHFIESRNCPIEYKTKTVKSAGDKTMLPSVYSVEDRWAVDTYTIKEGIVVKRATETHPDADKRKIIISNKSSFNGVFIDEGKLSLTGTCKTYILGDKLELIQKLLSFKISHIICHFTKYGQDFIQNECYTFIPDLRKLDINDITEDEFYQLIGLTEQEQDNIAVSFNS